MPKQLCTILQIALLTIVSCSDADPSAREERPSASAAPCDSATAQVAWDTGVSQIFQTQCASCHPGSQTTNYSTFNGVKSNFDAVMQRINDNTMPPAPSGPLASESRTKLDAWKAAGLLEKGCQNSN
jgi:cytochrome c5